MISTRDEQQGETTGKIRRFFTGPGRFLTTLEFWVVFAAFGLFFSCFLPPLLPVRPPVHHIGPFVVLDGSQETWLFIEISETVYRPPGASPNHTVHPVAQYFVAVGSEGILIKKAIPLGRTFNKNLSKFVSHAGKLYQIEPTDLNVRRWQDFSFQRIDEQEQKTLLEELKLTNLTTPQTFDRLEQLGTSGEWKVAHHHSHGPMIEMPLTLDEAGIRLIYERHPDHEQLWVEGTDATPPWRELVLDVAICPR